MALQAELVWKGGVAFDAVAGNAALVIDSDGITGPSPMQAVAVALSGCMAIDVVSILEKGRHPLTGLRVSFSAERAPQPPKRITTITLAFGITGNVSALAVERAIQLSRDKYCSVWHSLREDIALTTRFDIRA